MRIGVTRRLVSAFLTALMLGPGLAHAAQIESATVNTPADGVRNVLIARPAASPSGQRPLVILLHGHGGSANYVMGLTTDASPLAEWLAIADREGVIVAAPDGAVGGDGKQGWNDCRRDAPGNPATDDVAFVRAVIARLRAGNEIDPARIYVMGMSNGGMMTYRLAAELDTRLAAIAVASGGMAKNSECLAATRATPVLIIHGTSDPVVPYDGGDVRFGTVKRGPVLGVSAALDFWRRLDGLPAQPTSGPAQLPHTELLNTTRAVVSVYGANPAAAQVKLVSVTRGGHIEPSIAQRISGAYALLVGAQNHDLESAEMAWSFMSTKRAPP